jgi:hypothetical protein
MIREDALRRQLIGVADELSSNAYSGTGLEQAVVRASVDIAHIETDYGYTRGAFRFEDAEELNQGAIPPREWLLGTLLCREYVTVMASAGGVGKTSIALSWALSLASGRALVGDYVHHRSRVLIVTAEDNMEEMRRRLRAARMQHGIDVIGSGWLGVVCLTGMKDAVSIARVSDNGDVVETGDADRIAETIRLFRADAVILDPFVKLSGAPENSNDGTDVVMRALVRIADRCQCAVLVIHHNRKGQASPGDPDLARGAGSLIAAARIALTVTGMSPDEASTMGIPEEERVRLVRVDDAKVNLTPKATKARWYSLESVALGNGTPAYPKGDNVQAVVSWTPPETWDGLGSDVLNRILDDLDAGVDGERYRAGPKATALAAWTVVQLHAPDKTEAQCREIIRTWVANGLLKVEEYHSKSARRTVNGVVVDDAKRPS